MEGEVIDEIGKILKKVTTPQQKIRFGVVMIFRRDSVRLKRTFVQSLRSYVG